MCKWKSLEIVFWYTLIQCTCRNVFGWWTAWRNFVWQSTNGSCFKEFTTRITSKTHRLCWAWNAGGGGPTRVVWCFTCSVQCLTFDQQDFPLRCAMQGWGPWKSLFTCNGIDKAALTNWSHLGRPHQTAMYIQRDKMNLWAVSRAAHRWTLQARYNLSHCYL